MPWQVLPSKKVYDNLLYARGVDAFMNCFSGASDYAIRPGFHSVGAKDNTVEQGFVG